MLMDQIQDLIPRFSLIFKTAIWSLKNDRKSNEEVGCLRFLGALLANASGVKARSSPRKLC